MLTQEKVTIGAIELLHTYSDKFKIIQIETGLEYGEAYDVLPCKYTYKESENPLEVKDNE